MTRITFTIHIDVSHHPILFHPQLWMLTGVGWTLLREFE